MSTQAAPQMERMGQPIADAYEAVDSVVGNALNIVFQLSSWFADYETAPYTNIGDIQDDGIEERLYPSRKWVCTKKTSSTTDDDPKSGMFWSLFKYIQGENSLEAKIQMTTPVTTLVEKPSASTITHEMCFFIGGAYDTNTPTPTNDKVYIKQESQRKIFTRQLGGWMNPAKWATEIAELKEILTAKGLSFSDAR